MLHLLEFLHLVFVASESLLDPKLRQALNNQKYEHNVKGIDCAGISAVSTITVDSCPEEKEYQILLRLRAEWASLGRIVVKVREAGDVDESQTDDKQYHEA